VRFYKTNDVIAFVSTIIGKALQLGTLHVINYWINKGWIFYQTLYLFFNVFVVQLFVGGLVTSIGGSLVLELYQMVSE
jgi:hypothetical protein